MIIKYEIIIDDEHSEEIEIEIDSDIVRNAIRRIIKSMDSDEIYWMCVDLHNTTIEEYLYDEILEDKEVKRFINNYVKEVEL